MEVQYELIMTLQTIRTWRGETGNDGDIDKEKDGEGDDSNDRGRDDGETGGSCHQSSSSLSSP